MDVFWFGVVVGDLVYLVGYGWLVLLCCLGFYDEIEMFCLDEIFVDFGVGCGLLDVVY